MELGMNAHWSWANRRGQNPTTGMYLGDFEYNVNVNEDDKSWSKINEESALNMLGAFQVSSSSEEKTCCNVLMEILVTETSYVEDLQCLVNDYMIPLGKTMRSSTANDNPQPLLSEDDTRNIFCNIHTLLQLNTELLCGLQFGLIKLGQNGQITLLGIVAVFARAFHEIMPFFKLYAEYCQQYHVIIECLKECRQDVPQFDQFLQDRECRSQNGSINSLLIKPIQRICKYPLLFSTLLHELETTKQSSMDANVMELQRAAETINEIARKVNLQVGESKAMQDLLAVCDELGGAPGLMQAHRKFIRTEDVTYCAFAVDKECNRLIYLFNDVLIVAIPLVGKRITNSSSSNLLTSKMKRIGSRTTSIFNLKPTHHRTLSQKFNESAAAAAAAATGKQLAKIDKQVDIASMTISLLNARTNSCEYGIHVKHISRTVEAMPTRYFKRMGTSNNYELKIDTVVESFEIWYCEQDKRDDFFADLQRHIAHSCELKSNQSKAASAIGAQRKQRSWKQKAATNLAKGSVQTVLSQLEGKYVKIS